MHSELQALVDAAFVLREVESALFAAGVRADEDQGGYASGRFSRQYVLDAGLRLTWQLDVEARDGDDAAEDLSVDYTVGVMLFFGENSVFGVEYDETDDEWFVFLEIADENIGVRQDARDFAATLGISSDDEDATSVSKARAFEVICATVAYVKNFEEVFRRGRSGKMN